MDIITTLQADIDIYNSSYDFNTIENMSDLNNKLFATFTKEEELGDLVARIRSTYEIRFNKIFVLEILDTDELVISYNVDNGNVDSIPSNTILLHRKKESNTLYTINALNELIKKLNNGVVDVNYKVDWNHYKNCILLTQHNSLKQLNTKIHSILEL